LCFIAKVCRDISNGIWDINSVLPEHQLNLFVGFNDPRSSNQQFSYSAADKNLRSGFSNGTCLTLSPEDRVVRAAPCITGKYLTQMWMLWAV